MAPHARPFHLIRLLVTRPLALLPVLGLVCGLFAVERAPAQSSTDQDTPSAKKAGGCWSKGQWYPEGSIQTPDRRSRIAVPGSFVCRGGKWVFDPQVR